MIYLHFSKANAKLVKLQKLLGKKVYSFDTLSGGSNCPYANECNSRVIYTENGFRIQDGPNTQFRCFSASQEALFPALRNSRLQNSQLREVAARSVSKMVDTIVYQFPQDCDVLRIHVAGDHSTQNYFDAWLEVARKLPSVVFYCYTKSLPFWVRRINDIPANFRLTASFGGMRDDLIAQYNLPYAKVVFSEKEANLLGLPIDNDDSHAYNGGSSFALLLHGPQPQKSEASKALQELKGKGSYGRKVANV